MVKIGSLPASLTKNQNTLYRSGIALTLIKVRIRAVKARRIQRGQLYYYYAITPINAQTVTIPAAT